MDRREFLKYLFSAFLFGKGRVPLHKGKGEWNLREHFQEFIESPDYIFPWPGEFNYGERVVLLRRMDRIGSRFRKYPFGAMLLDLFLKERVDIKVYYSNSLRSINRTRPRVFKGVKGTLRVHLPVYDGEEVFYQVLYSRDKKFRPLSPVRRVKNFLFSPGPIRAYLFADGHVFDDHFDRAIPLREDPVREGWEGRFFHNFFRKALSDPLWALKEDDPNTYSLHLRNSFHLAEAFSFVVLRGIQPHLIIKLGDDVGLDNYRLKRQGLRRGEREKNAKLLWERERKIWSILTPLIPVYQVIGNHDGEKGVAKYPAIRWRKITFPQPGELEGGSPLEDFYTLEVGDWLQFIVLNVVGYTNKPPRTPSHWTLGIPQFKWLEKVLSNSEYPLRFIFFHHVVGGFPSGPEGEKGKAYGRGPLFTREDYIRHSLNPDKIEQVKITEMALKHGVKGFFYGHDHIHFLKKYEDFFAMTVGTTNEVAGENAWEKIEGWEEEYGMAERFDFLNAPLLEELQIGRERMLINTYCVSIPDSESNLKNLGAGFGEKLSSETIRF